MSVLATLHFVLIPGGYLFLGKSEALVSRSQLFEVVSLRHRLFRKDGTVSEMVPLVPSLAPSRSRSAAQATGPGSRRR